MARVIRFTHFIRKYAPPRGTPEHKQFMEDLRQVIVESMKSFRRDQIDGDFTDGTGDKFLEACDKYTLNPYGETRLDPDDEEV